MFAWVDSGHPLAFAYGLEANVWREANKTEISDDPNSGHAGDADAQLPWN
jgi:hypothetical protein